MAFTKMLTLLLILGTISGFNAQSRIIGGVDTQLKYPFAVSIQDVNYKHVCGGSILDSRWILTSASCIQLSTAGVPIQIRYIIAGTSYIDEAGSMHGDLYTIKKMIPHPSYVAAPTLAYNIGLIKSRQTIDLYGNARSIYIYFYNVANGQNLMQAGWGKYSTATNAASSSNVLLAANITVVSNDDCKSAGKEEITSSEFCGMRPGAGACTGDTGNPVFYYNTYLYGMVVDDKNCGKDHFDRYIKVSNFYAWIADVKRLNP